MMNVAEYAPASYRPSDHEVEIPAGTSESVYVQFPLKLQPLFEPWRFKVGKGGRGSAKSWGFVRALIAIAYSSKKRILCCREFQNSITESVHRLIADQIDLMGLSDYFIVQQNVIYGVNGSEFIFAGIRSNPNKIKSTEGIDIAYVEEAELISARSWEILIPTVRKEDSEIWLVFNPYEETDPTNQRFIVNQPDNCKVIEMNYGDNPWFPEVLRREMEYDYRVDPENAAHIWEGKYKTRNAAAIFGPTRDANGVLVPKWIVEDFVPVTKGKDPWDGPYDGLDFGFSDDPLVGMRVWVNGRKLMIEREAWGQHVENNDIAPLLRQMIPGVERSTLWADNSRPETISHVHKEGGLLCKPADKWSGSVEDGIAFLRSFELIVIHSRCKHMVVEAREYSYKVDRLTKQVTTDIVDKFNHCWDAVRYAIGKLIKHKRSIYDNL